MEAHELHQTTDATVWAREFVARHGGDAELMVGWFANAMAAAEIKAAHFDLYCEVRDPDFLTTMQADMIQLGAESKREGKPLREILCLRVAVDLEAVIAFLQRDEATERLESALAKAEGMVSHLASETRPSPAEEEEGPFPPLFCEFCGRTEEEGAVIELGDGSIGCPEEERDACDARSVEKYAKTAPDPEPD